MFGRESLGIIININYLSFMKILSENSSNSSSSWKKKNEVGLNKITLFSLEN